MVTMLLSTTMMLSAQTFMSINAIMDNDEEDWSYVEGVLVITGSRMDISVGLLEATVIIDKSTCEKLEYSDGTEYKIWQGRLILKDSDTGENTINSVELREIELESGNTNYIIYFSDSLYFKINATRV